MPARWSSAARRGRRRGAVRGLALETVNACIQFLPTLDGKALFTVEDLKALAPGAALHPTQQAMVDCHGSQCGFCTPGFVMSLWSAYEHHQACGSRPTRQQLADELSGNLCRCTGYRPILDAGQRMFDLPSVQLDTAPVIAALQGLARRRRPSAVRAPARHFHAPRTLDALAALRERMPAAQLLAGSTDVGLWVTKQLRDLGEIIYVGEVEELKRIETRGDGLWIGAGASLESAWRALAQRWPTLTDVWLRFASPPIRHAGTMGGNVANGSPIGDSAPVLMALDAQIELRTRRARAAPAAARVLRRLHEEPPRARRVRAGDAGAAAAAPSGRCAPTRSANASTATSRRCVPGLAIELDGDTVREVRLAYGGMAAIVKRAAAAEAALLGKTWSPDNVARAQAALAQDFKPLSDMRASATYRLQVAQNLLQRFWLETRPRARPGRQQPPACGA